MIHQMKLIPPAFVPPLDEGFRPAILANRHFNRGVKTSGGGKRFILALERNEGGVARFEGNVFPSGHPREIENNYYVERILKFMIWQYGGWRLFIAAPPPVSEFIQQIYAPKGSRCFDRIFMEQEVYLQPFTIQPCRLEDVPETKKTEKNIGRHLDGCRIGFDLGASDLKISAVVDGQPMFSEEIVWEPRRQTSPEYHYQHLMAAIQKAAKHMTRVDAIGGSSAGIYINNHVMVASLFRGIPREHFAEVRTLFLRIQQELGVPLEVINDGEVTALAGSMSLEDNAVLGIAMGSSQAAGYINQRGAITGWLNELAFAPVDYNPSAATDEWSGDIGVGSQYFSQQCVFRLAPAAGIQIPSGLTDAERLLYVQDLLESGHEGALKIWQSIGIYLGYGIAHYADFYDIKHLLILGRVTSGKGGEIILDGARQVVIGEFPELAKNISIQLPDDKSRRVGQSIAAASLPLIG